MQFTDLDLPEKLQHSLAKLNFVNPTKIQSKSFPTLMRGRDLIACSQTGSGKTGAYLIPMVKQLIEDDDAQGMVLAPTRELAIQIANFLKELTGNSKDLPVVQLVGGQDIRKQFKALQRKPRVIIATPGRLIDHLKRNTVQIHKVNTLVIDEGDRMIDMGFSIQLKEILKHLPKKRQTSFFTATLDDKVQKLASQYLYKPERLMVSQAKPVAEIKQSVISVELKDKDECVLQEITQRDGTMIIFTKTKYRTDRLKSYLADYGLSVDSIHGGKTQGQRNRSINKFKQQKTRILCATDVAARGLDIPHVETVINFDIPMQDEDYVHRVGRTARNGASGEAVTFVSDNEKIDWNRIAKKYQINDCLFQDVSKPKRKAKSGGRGKKFGSGRSSGGGKKKSSSRKKKKSLDSFGNKRPTRKKRRR